MRIVVKLVTVLIICCISLGANALIINTDHDSLGENSQFFDDFSNLTYLDVSYTAGMSINQSLALYSGYRVATKAEVLGLFNGVFTGVGLDANGRFSQKQSNTHNDLFESAFDNFVDVAGYTSRTSSYWAGQRVNHESLISGFFLNDDGSVGFAKSQINQLIEFQCEGWSCSSEVDYFETDYKTFFSSPSYLDFDSPGSTGASTSNGQLRYHTSVFLVKNIVPVPEPSSLALLGIGIAGLRLAWRKQKV